MKIPISKYQYDLLSKRNIASEGATNTAKTAELVARQAAANADQLRAALLDVVSCISLSAGNQPAEYAGFSFGDDGNGGLFLDLQEKPKA